MRTFFEWIEKTVQHIINRWIKPASVHIDADFPVSIHDNILHIKKANWFAPGTFSPQKNYLAAAKQSVLVLVDVREKRIVYIQKQLQNINPYNLHVTEQGMVFLEDNRDREEALQSALIALQKDGSPLFEMKVGANIERIVYDQTQTMAVFTTTASAHPEFDRRLFIIDIASGQKLHSWKLERSAPADCTIDVQNRIITLHYGTSGSKPAHSQSMAKNAPAVTGSAPKGAKEAKVPGKEVYTFTGERISP
jgi:hypothetical protein